MSESAAVGPVPSESPGRLSVVPPSPEVDHLLSIAEAADYLNVPESWLREKVTARKVPFARIGRHVRFTIVHLREIVTAGDQPVLKPVASARRGR